MPFKVGDDVEVTFCGRQHRGEIFATGSTNWVIARIIIDPNYDYGSVSARLDPISTVCIKKENVKPWEKKQ